MLALSDTSVNGIFAVTIALITGGMGIAGILLSRSTKRANDGIDELARDHADCLETLDWVVGQLEKDRQVDRLPPSAVRIRAQAARAAAQAAREKAERQRSRSVP